VTEADNVPKANCRILVALSLDVESKRGVAVSLFSGAGGLDLGAEQAGYQVRAAVEYSNDAADTMEKNFPDLHTPVIRRNILEVSSAEIREAAGLGRRERPDLLIGGPPCTPFSKSSFWLDWKREGLDPNASLLQEYTRVLRDLKPLYFVLENVYALTYNNRQSRPHFERLLHEIDEYGYKCNWDVLNAANFGVPQARPRLVIVGAPKGSRTPGLPDPTHGGRWERQDVGKVDTPHVTAGTALENLTTAPEPADEVAGQYGHLLPAIPPGSNYLHYTAERGYPDPLFKWRSRYWSFLLKLDPTKPAPTIQAQPGPYVGPFHWENRRLRVAELKRFFTFPDDFELVGSRNSIQSQLGNSVPPLLAKTVINALAEEG
jgi:DNA (cytosine-5)-methyltransferase 1